MTDAASLRVGHEEREHVVLALRQQYAEGRLRPQELQERMAMARAARTFADLDGLVADLPILAPSSELTRPSGPRVQVSGAGEVGADPDHRLTLTAGVSSHVRRGIWTVPAYLRLNVGLGTVKLDFQQAICPHPVVDIAVLGGLGTVVLVVPVGWGATTDRVGKGIGSVSNRVDEVPQPGRPLLVLHGSSAAGSVRVRYPGWHDRRAARRAERRVRGGVAGRPVGRTGSAAPVAGGWSAGPQDAPPSR
ncbi:MAG: DUF1707 domain-containing protein [Lapillicoccus sp.]